MLKRSALITGSSSGIGFAYAKLLSQKGWHLDLISQNQERSQKALDKLAYANCNSYICDLSSAESLVNVINNIPLPDLIVANAGIGITGPVGKNNSDNIADASYLMFGGVIELIEYYLPQMKIRNSGRVVIISSMFTCIPVAKGKDFKIYRKDSNNSRFPF